MSANTSTKVLIFGKNGQVGSNLYELLSRQCEFEVEGVDIDEVDLTNTEGIGDYIASSDPQWVINASAHTAVDRAESEKELSYKLNADAPEAMAKSCAARNLGFIHYSTDYVFDGTADTPYVETDKTNPMSIYGKSKLAGEIAVYKHLLNAIIFRTAWVYSKDGNNFVNTMLRVAKEKSELSIVDDQFGSPTLADDLANTTVNILTGIVSGKYQLQGGVFHATGGGQTNWFEFCKAIMEMTENNHIILNPISTSQYPTPAPRPAYSVLSNQKLRAVYEQELPEWRDALSRCLR